MALFHDTFTVESDVLLENHAPDTGSGWELVFNTAASTQIIVKAVSDGDGSQSAVGPSVNENSVSVRYLANPAPPSSEYDISCKFYHSNWDLINTYLRGIVARWDEDGSVDGPTGYVVIIRQNGHSTASIELRVVTGAGSTRLGLYDHDFVNGDVVTFEVRDAAKKVYVNGVEVISSNNNDVTAAGRAGLFWGPIPGVSGHIDRRCDVDDFTVTTVGGDPEPPTVEPTGISSNEAFGTPFVYRGSVSAFPTGISRDEVFGTASVAPGSVTVSPTGIPIDELFGEPDFSTSVTILPFGIPDNEGLGEPAVSTRNEVYPTGIPRDEAFGDTGISYRIHPTGIPRTETFGQGKVTGRVRLVTTSVPRTETFGTPTLRAYIRIVPAGLSRNEAFGSPEVIRAAIAVQPVGIPRTEKFGNPFVFRGAVKVRPEGIARDEAFGEAVLVPETMVVSPTGIALDEMFGTARLSRQSVLSPYTVIIPYEYSTVTVAAGYEPIEVDARYDPTLLPQMYTSIVVPAQHSPLVVLVTYAPL